MKFEFTKLFYCTPSDGLTPDACCYKLAMPAMSATSSTNQAETHAYPALHKAMGLGLIGKDGVRFEGADLFLSLPHTDIDSSDGDLRRFVDKLAARNLRAGSLVAPVWGETGDGSARWNREGRRGARQDRPDGPNGKLDLVEDAGANTWNGVLRTMIAVRNAHGWE
jgi:hypothetical protein